MSLIKDVRDGLLRLDQSAKSLRKFAIVMGVVLIFLALFIFLFGSVQQRAYWLAGLSLLFFITGWIKPVWLKSVHLMWMGLALLLGWFMSRLLLSLIFIFIFSPAGLILRLLGKDMLKQKIDKNSTSYWIKREDDGIRPELYEKQF